MWKLFDKSKKDNTLILSDSFINFLKKRYKDKGICSSKLSYSVGDNLNILVNLRIYESKSDTFEKIRKEFLHEV